jgi:dTDP-4-dehydrorhamnose 3,5-epimerase
MLYYERYYDRSGTEECHLPTVYGRFKEQIRDAPTRAHTIMSNIVESRLIPGVKIVWLRSFQDERGQFMETFRKDWFPERSWDVVQSNRSDSMAGVLRGLHFHRYQVDYWHVARGEIRVALADLRRSSTAFGASEVIELGQNKPAGLFIPIGVAHGFYAKTDATLSYIVDNYYDGHDELGIAWNDPALKINWGVTAPLLSERDRANRFLSAVAQEDLPD